MWKFHAISILLLYIQMSNYKFLLFSSFTSVTKNLGDFQIPLEAPSLYTQKIIIYIIISRVNNYLPLIIYHINT